MSEAIAEPVADEAAVADEPVVDEPVAEAAEETTPDWRNDPEIRDYLDNEVDARLEARLAQWNANGQRGEQPTAANEDTELDFFAEDAGAKFDAYMQKREEGLIGQFKELVSPMLAAYEREAQREGSELIKDVFESLDVGGDYDKTAATDLFHAYKAESVAKYGETPRALEHAAERAARRQREIEDVAEKRGVEAYKNHMKTLSGAQREGDVRQAGQSIPGEYSDENDVATNWRPS